MVDEALWKALLHTWSTVAKEAAEQHVLLRYAAPCAGHHTVHAPQQQEVPPSPHAPQQQQQEVLPNPHAPNKSTRVQGDNTERPAESSAPVARFHTAKHIPTPHDPSPRAAPAVHTTTEPMMGSPPTSKDTATYTHGLPTMVNKVVNTAVNTTTTQINAAVNTVVNAGVNTDTVAYTKTAMQTSAATTTSTQTTASSLLTIPPSVPTTTTVAVQACVATATTGTSVLPMVSQAVQTTTDTASQTVVEVGHIMVDRSMHSVVVDTVLPAVCAEDPADRQHSDDAVEKAQREAAGQHPCTTAIQAVDEALVPQNHSNAHQSPQPLQQQHQNTHQHTTYNTNDHGVDDDATLNHTTVKDITCIVQDQHSDSTPPCSNNTVHDTPEDTPPSARWVTLTTGALPPTNQGAPHQQNPTTTREWRLKSNSSSTTPNSSSTTPNSNNNKSPTPSSTTTSSSMLCDTTSTSVTSSTASWEVYIEHKSNLMALQMRLAQLEAQLRM